METHRIWLDGSDGYCFTPNGQANGDTITGILKRELPVGTVRIDPHFDSMGWTGINGEYWTVTKLNKKGEWKGKKNQAFKTKQEAYKYAFKKNPPAYSQPDDETIILKLKAKLKELEETSEAKIKALEEEKARLLSLEPYELWCEQHGIEHCKDTIQKYYNWLTSEEVPSAKQSLARTHDYS